MRNVDIKARYGKRKTIFNQKLESSKNTLVIGHKGLDFDRVGSCGATGIYAEKKGNYLSLDNITLYSEEPEVFRTQYGFLAHTYYMVSTIKDISEYDLVIVLDCERLDRVGRISEELKKAKYIVNIDHHDKNKMFGHLNIVDKNASSTSEILYFLMDDEFIDDDIANCLYTGISSDTGNFRHNFSADTHYVAGKLINHGADPTWIYNCMEKPWSKEKINFFGEVLQNIEYYNQLAYVLIDCESINKAGLGIGDTGFIHPWLGKTSEVNVWVQIQIMNLDDENPDNNLFKLSLRSKRGSNINVRAFAERYPYGGGHLGAAGCDVAGVSLEQLKKDLFQFIDNLK